MGVNIVYYTRGEKQMWDWMCDSYSVECSHYDFHLCGAVYFVRYKIKFFPAHTMETCRGNGVDLDTGRRWAIGLTLRPHYSRWISTPSSLNRRLGVSQSGSGRFGEEKYLLPLLGFKLRFVQTVNLAVSWLSCKATVFWQIGTNLSGVTYQENVMGIGLGCSRTRV